MQKTRVLVVDDSLTARKHLIEVLSADPELEVAGEAEDGKRAIELCRALRPDVITLDMMLPVMSGVAVTEYVMAYFSTPILFVSSSPSENPSAPRLPSGSTASQRCAFATPTMGKTYRHSGRRAS